jgi:carbonic anhydrase
MSVTDELVRNAQAYAATFAGGVPSPRPKRHVAVVACMDARLNLFPLLGLDEGDAHIIRNAGGVVTDDTIRSLAISQRKLGTREIVLVHHTDCGLLSFTEDEFRQELELETGLRPTWATETFRDVDEDVRQSMARIHASPFIPHKACVRGFVYEVESGRLREIVRAPARQTPESPPA